MVAPFGRVILAQPLVDGLLAAEIPVHRYVRPVGKIPFFQWMEGEYFLGRVEISLAVLEGK